MDDKTGDVLVKVVDNAVAAFLQYRNAASTLALERAAQAIAATWQTGKRIEFYGVGNSGIVAQDAQHKFFRLGVTSIATSDGHMQVMSATLLGPGDCAVIISNSGRTRDLMDAADIARKNGATTIAITASGSPLASTCQIHLAADHPRGLRPLQPHGVAAHAPAHHRRAGHLRGPAHWQLPAAHPAADEGEPAGQALRLNAAPCAENREEAPGKLCSNTPQATAAFQRLSNSVALTPPNQSR